MVKYQKQKSISSRYHNFKFGDKKTNETYIIMIFWGKNSTTKKIRKNQFVPLFFNLLTITYLCRYYSLHNRNIYIFKLGAPIRKELLEEKKIGNFDLFNFFANNFLYIFSAKCKHFFFHACINSLHVTYINSEWPKLVWNEIVAAQSA